MNRISINEFFTNPIKQGVYLSEIETPCIICGDSKYLGETDLPVYKGDQGGLIGSGPIVLSPGSLHLAVIRPISDGFMSQKFLDKLSEFIGQGAMIEGNDLLVNGQKVASGVETITGDLIYFAYQFSFGQLPDVISQVCKKEAKHIPGVIPVGKEDLINFLQNYFG